MIDTTQIMYLLAKPPALNESIGAFDKLLFHNVMKKPMRNVKCLNCGHFGHHFKRCRNPTQEVRLTALASTVECCLDISTFPPTCRLPFSFSQGLEVISMFEAEQSRQERKKNTPLTVIEPYIKDATLFVFGW